MFACSIEMKGDRMLGCVRPAGPFDFAGLGNAAQMSEAANAAGRAGDAFEARAGQSARDAIGRRTQAAKLAEAMLTARATGDQTKYARLAAQYAELVEQARVDAMTSRTYGKAATRSYAIGSEMSRAASLAGIGVISGASSSLLRAQSIYDANGEVLEGASSPGTQQRNRRRDRAMGIGGGLGALSGVVEDRINAKIAEIANNFCADADAGSCAGAALGAIFGSTSATGPNAAKCGLCATLAVAGGLVAQNLSWVRSVDALGLRQPILEAAYVEAFGTKPTSDTLNAVNRWFVSGGGKGLETAASLVNQLKANAETFAPNAAELRAQKEIQAGKAKTEAQDARRQAYVADVNTATTSAQVTNTIKRIAADTLLPPSVKAEITAIAVRVRDQLAGNEALREAENKKNQQKAGVGGGSSGGGGGLLAAIAAGIALLS